MELLRIWCITMSLQTSSPQTRHQTVIQLLDSSALGQKKVGTGFHSTFMNSLFLCCLLHRFLPIPIK